VFLRGRTSPGIPLKVLSGSAGEGRLSIIGFTLESLERDYRK